MSESREYSKRERKRRGVDLSAIEKLKQARSGQTKAIDNVKVCLCLVLSPQVPHSLII
jgi:hypothetical protein